MNINFVLGHITKEQLNMNYMQINKFDTVNGEGIRVSLFVSGCKHQCVGCWNEDSWRFEAGNKFTHNELFSVLNTLLDEDISGLSILGGEPLVDRNLQSVITICKEAKQLAKNKTIWLWSGYTLEQIQNHKKRKQILEYIDVLIDGKFVESLKNDALEWRGSSNQNILMKGVAF